MAEGTTTSTEDAPKPLTPGSSVKHLTGVGPARLKLLNRLGIHTLADLIRHLPARYEDQSAESGIKDLVQDNKTVGSARGVIEATRWQAGQYGRKGRFMATLKDDTGTLSLVWFNAGYLREKLFVGHTLRVQGKCKTFNGYPQMANPKWELLTEQDAETKPARDARLRPVYPTTEGLSAPVLEGLINEALDRVLPTLEDPLPSELTAGHNMPTLAEAFRLIHQPAEADDHKAARRRLAYNELLLLQLGIAMKRAYVINKQVAPALPASVTIDEHIRERFPFELTDSQNKVIAEIAADLANSEPMNRLVQGDVGSGKTVLALYAMLLAVAEKKQAALMAPTELLAEQHHRCISAMLQGTNVRLRLMTGSQSTSGSKERQALLEGIATGTADIVIGTQALVTDAVRFKDLAVAVVDEQHRFGVMQKARLRENDDHDEQGRLRVPHHLVMTATPIPRTLSLTIFGDLDVSTITGKPPGRVPAQNRVVGQDKASEVYDYLKTRLARGEQAYVVVPMIDSSSDTEEGNNAAGLRNVTDTAEMLRKVLGKDYSVAEVHGRLPRDEREQVMAGFRAGESHVLVATTVIEVGVDVPNASVMIIEHAERFGLAQLHQLRGRIGRGASSRRPLCVFISEPTTDDALARMDAIASTNDGFKIAELDLQIRGMGDFFGTRQSGMPPLRVAQIPEDIDLLKLAHIDAGPRIEEDWQLTDPKHARLHKVVHQQYGEALGLIDVG
ncbi:MAG: ATP-dependent DNA helicase RecG [Phycisphaeraceae bacterium]|nr:ATP-dependent DNA helicase RecG [Phycisphaeraceae bacterium]